MKGLTMPRGVTVIGVLMALAAVFLDHEVVTALAPFIGANAAAKLAGIGTLLAAFGRALGDQAATTRQDPGAP